jgi:hypothetical protein
LGTVLPLGNVTVIVPLFAASPPVELVVNSASYVTPCTPAAVEDSATEGAITDEPAARAGAAASTLLMQSTPRTAYQIPGRPRATAAKRLARRTSITDSPFMSSSRFPLVGVHEACDINARSPG